MILGNIWVYMRHSWSDRMGRLMCLWRKWQYVWKPTEYTQSDSGEGGESSIDEYYKVGQDVFYFQDNGAFSGFSINENKFSVLTLWITDGIRVGDKLSKLDNFKYGKPKVASWLKPENGFVEYAIFYNHLDAFVYLSVKDGVIHNIRYSDPT